MKFDEYLEILTQENGSDLYITANALATIRVNGTMTPIEADPLTPQATKEIAYSIMNPDQIKTFEKSPEMNLSYATKTGRFRVNIFMQKADIGIVARNIKTEIPNMDDLGLPSTVLRDVVMKKRGLILFVGATGSGKSTSLAAMIDYRNRNDAGHIITIEDPLEYIHIHRKSIMTQREVGFDTDSYNEALKNTLRQAPDVILIGEIRTSETMEHAITFAETGHLCLSTLHANNSNQAFARILSFFPSERHSRVLLDLSLNLRAIISQRLIPCIQGGRIPAVEILLDNPLVRELVKKGEFREIKDVMAKSNLMGMQTFDQSLYNLYRAGKITYEDAIINADSANDLRLRISLDETMAEEGEGGEQGAGDATKAETNTTGDTTDLHEKAAEKFRKKGSGLSLEKDDTKEDDTGFIRR